MLAQMSPSFVLKLSFNLLNFYRGHPIVFIQLKDNKIVLAHHVQELVTQDKIYTFILIT